MLPYKMPWYVALSFYFWWFLLCLWLFQLFH